VQDSNTASYKLSGLELISNFFDKTLTVKNFSGQGQSVTNSTSHSSITNTHRKIACLLLSNIFWGKMHFGICHFLKSAAYEQH